MRAGDLDAVAVDGQCVFGDLEAAFFGHFLLAHFDVFVEEFLDPATIDALVAYLVTLN